MPVSSCAPTRKAAPTCPVSGPASSGHGRFLDAEGTVQERDFVGLWATSVQHQIDHLEGRMYFDRLSKVKRDMLLRRARKG